MDLGAAHGGTGILSELMHVPWRCSDAGTKKLLQDALALACIKAYELWGAASPGGH